jgi:hypothetical protein
LQFHPLQQLVSVALVLGAGARQRAQLFDLSGQLIARALEVRQIQQQRPGLPTGRGRRRDVREAVDHDRSQLALEPCDLRLQRLPGRSLGVARAIPLDRRAVARIGLANAQAPFA